MLILSASGLAGGFLAGLTGLGGGVIYAPVLFFYYTSLGIEDEVIAPLTIGTSLFCSLVGVSVSALFQYRRGAVIVAVAVPTGLASAAAVFVVTRYVTTQPWYGADAFQIVFAVVLVFLATGMLRGPAVVLHERSVADRPPLRQSLKWAFAIGTPAGMISAAVGVGGGLLLVPSYHRLLRLPMRVAIGTSSATVVIIALFGVLTNILLGWGHPLAPTTAVGFVDVGQALFLAIPAIFAARLGVWAAHAVPPRLLRHGFALIALIVAARLFLRALG
jgi:uncharacterized membrane protein YfcA